MRPDFRAGFLTGIAFMILVIVLIGLWPAKAETWLTVPLGSYHFDREGKHNERNFGIGVKHFVSERNVIAGGVYRNSNDIDSGYLLGGRCFYRSTYVCGGTLFGLVTGYERHAILIGGLAVTLHRKTWGITVLGFPKDGGVIGLQVERRFW